MNEATEERGIRGEDERGIVWRRCKNITGDSQPHSPSSILSISPLHARTFYISPRERRVFLPLERIISFASSGNAIGLKSWRKKVDSRNSKFTSMSFGVFSSIFLVLFCSRFFLFFFSFLIAYTFELFFIDVSTILTRRIISSRKSYFVATIFRCDRSFLGNTIASLIANQLRS